MKTWKKALRRVCARGESRSLAVPAGVVALAERLGRVSGETWEGVCLSLLDGAVLQQARKAAEGKAVRFNGRWSS